MSPSKQFEEKKKVLIVDDDPNIVELVKDTLTAAQYSVLGAYSGTEAMQLMEKEKVHMLVVDLMLSEEMSGYEFCKKIKKSKETAGIPILILSAKSQLNDKLQAVDVGADDYMVKPFTPDELTKRVRLNLHLSKG